MSYKQGGKLKLVKDWMSYHFTWKDMESVTRWLTIVKLCKHKREIYLHTHT